MGSCQIKIFNNSNTPLIHNMDWMKDIHDETKISEMTIPGTHDSCSLFLVFAVLGHKLGP